MEISPSNFKFIRNFRKKIMLANSSKPKQAIKDIKISNQFFKSLAVLVCNLIHVGSKRLKTL